MFKRTMIGSAFGATAILIGLAIPASAQSTAQPPAGQADTYHHNGWHEYGWHHDSWNRDYERSSWNDGYYDRGWNGYDRAAYGYGDRYGYGYDRPYYRGPIEEGFGVAGDVVAGAGEVVGDTVGTVGAAFAGPYPSYYAAGPGPGAVSYCAQRFRSYDPATGSYLGFDGLRHACP